MYMYVYLYACMMSAGMYVYERTILVQFVPSGSDSLDPKSKMESSTR